MRARARLALANLHGGLDVIVRAGTGISRVYDERRKGWQAGWLDVIEEGRQVERRKVFGRVGGRLWLMREEGGGVGLKLREEPHAHMVEAFTSRLEKLPR